MLFKNITFFRFPKTIDFSQINELLPQAQLKPVGAMDLNSRGFISPLGREEKQQLSRQINNALWLTVGAETKILPASVVNDLLEQKIEKIFQQQGRRPGGRERRQLKTDLIAELLPRAFIKNTRTDAWLDLENGFVAINCSSQKTGETFISDIRKLLGSFPAVPLSTATAPRALLTEWIAGKPLPNGLMLGHECEMKDPVEGGAIVRCQHHELRCAEIDKHLDAGKKATKVALQFEDTLSFVLGEDLILRKLKFLDGALDQLEHSAEADRQMEFDALFVLQSGEIRRLFTLLEKVFTLNSV